MAKKIQLPLWVEREADHFAKEYCRKKGCKPGSSGYSKLFKKAKHDIFFTETFTHSLSPGDVAGSNPYTPRVSPLIYEGFDDVARLLTSGGGDKVLVENFKSSVTHLVQIFMKTRMGMKTEADFDFKKGMSETQMKEVVVRQYLRAYLANVMLSVLRKVYEMSPNRISSLMSARGLDSASLNTLRAKTTRAEFNKRIRDAYRSALEDLDLVSVIALPQTRLPR